MVTPTEVVTDRAATYTIIMDDCSSGMAPHEQYANNQVEADDA
jgi:hypothetical protein